MKHSLTSLLLIPLCAAPLLAADPAVPAPDPALNTAIAAARDDIRMQAVELTEVRKRIGEQRSLLSTRLETLSAHVAALRRQSDNLAEQRRITRDEEQRLFDEVRQLTEECDFVRGAFREYRRSVPLRAGHAEAAYAETLLPDVDELLRVGAPASGLPTAADELVGFAETWNLARYGGMRFAGKATDDDGIQHDGQFVVVGPHGWFASTDGAIAGLAVSQPNSLNVAVREAKPADAAAIKALVDGKPTSVPVDVSGGDALKVAAARPGLGEQWTSGGFVMYPLAMVAVAALFLALAKHVSLARMTVDLVGPLSADADALENMAAVSRAPLRPLLEEACTHRQAPRAHLEEVLSETVAAQVPFFERHLGTLAVLGGVAPLLGLLGTVTGMIHTFELVNSLGTGNARLLSGGISEALVTTKFGLAIAIPVLLAHAFLARRSRLKLSQLEHAAARLVNLICPRSAEQH